MFSQLDIGTLVLWFNGFLIFKLLQKGGEAVDCASLDCDLTETKGCIEGGLQEEEVLAP